MRVLIKSLDRKETAWARWAQTAWWRLPDGVKAWLWDGRPLWAKPHCLQCRNLK